MESGKGSIAGALGFEIAGGAAAADDRGARIGVAVRLGARWVAIALIRLYQAALAPFLGPCCRFEPSCSRFAVEAIERHGLARGTALAMWRVLRCHPFSRGGPDPVPPVKRERGP